MCTKPRIPGKYVKRRTRDALLAPNFQIFSLGDLHGQIKEILYSNVEHHVMRNPALNGDSTDITDHNIIGIIVKHSTELFVEH